MNMHNLRQLQLHSQASSSHPPDPGDTSAAAAGRWAAKLLRECAAAVAEKDSARIHHLLWMLNELASPYGDREQRLASHFLQALFCRATDSGDRCLRTLTSVAERSRSFESTRRVMLRFQEASPWATFGHVAANGAILEAMEGEPKLHIIDISNTYCTQWPTLLEALATRSDEAPHLRLTVVVTTGAGDSVVREIGRRMERFARLMGVPFEFCMVGALPRLAELREEALKLREDEAVAVNCLGALRRVSTDERGAFVAMLRSLQPKVVTVVEEEADFSAGAGDDFAGCFDECLRFYTLFFEMLEESFAATSNERLALERECARALVGVLACDGDDGAAGGDSERRERATQWCERLVQAFSPAEFSDDVVDDVRALLKRYPAGWSLLPARAEVPGLYLTWKEEPVVWASAWKM
ncbi:hypothetical protein Taro_028021 [Colocasia esculenta]|uniref:SHORT-ROOT protein n=1 Tax=Colocasia esculenta TaxID=4460 RepID=A0A843VVX8_COLES|nr:hypothetical protein [Colocasia esculenta]